MNPHVQLMANIVAFIAHCLSSIHPPDIFKANPQHIVYVNISLHVYVKCISLKQIFKMNQNTIIPKNKFSDSSIWLNTYSVHILYISPFLIII